MISHNVYFWLKPELTEKEREAFKGFFDKLRPIPVIKELTVGIPAATDQREVVDNSFTYALQVTFDSVEKHDLYQNHSYHLEAVEEYSQYWTRVLVHDFEVI